MKNTNEDRGIDTGSVTNLQEQPSKDGVVKAEEGLQSHEVSVVQKNEDSREVGVVNKKANNILWGAIISFFNMFGLFESHEKKFGKKFNFIIENANNDNLVAVNRDTESTSGGSYYRGHDYKNHLKKSRQAKIYIDEISTHIQQTSCQFCIGTINDSPLLLSKFPDMVSESAIKPIKSPKKKSKDKSDKH